MYPQSNEPTETGMGKEQGAQAEQVGPLELWLHDRISTSGPMTIAEFMGHALYHPQYGYYTKGPNIGPRGDFVTSPEASPAFGRLFALHLVEIDRVLGSPTVFNAIEFGPGRGTLARDLLDELQSAYPELYGRLKYWLVDVSPALRETQIESLLVRHSTKVDWREDVTELPPGLMGAVIGNELVDAFPVHVVENRNGTLSEQVVVLDTLGNLEIAYLPLTDADLIRFLTDEGIILEDGEQVEINLEVEGWLKSLSDVVERGVVTLIDYGDESPARYSAARREGTLLGYYGGTVNASILAHPGKQDLTALVDFTALMHSAQRAQFSVVAILRQANFLLGLGLGTTHTPETVIQSGNLDEIMQYRKGLHSLISMEGLGRFHVLLLAKAVDVSSGEQVLSALKYANF
jgi:SAM-dependent MidA family methyltransferase